MTRCDIMKKINILLFASIGGFLNIILHIIQRCIYLDFNNYMININNLHIIWCGINNHDFYRNLAISNLFVIGFILVFIILLIYEKIKIEKITQ